MTVVMAIPAVFVVVLGLGRAEGPGHYKQSCERKQNTLHEFILPIGGA
jgi:hypothetical protein